MDQPGRYIYLHDHESKDYWSASWQPVGKPLDQYKSECRHGSAYTVISSEYDGIGSETTYFVPLGKNFECWHVKLTNLSERPRELSAFTYVEYAGNWVAADDLINLQYTQHTVKMEVEDNIIDHGTNVNIPSCRITSRRKIRDVIPFRHWWEPRSLAMTRTAPPSSGVIAVMAILRLSSRDNARTRWPSATMPAARCKPGSALAPGETKEFLVLMGIGRAREEGKAAVAEFGSMEKVREELAKLKSYWHERIAGLTVETPDAELNSTLNMWGPFNCLMTYAWSRAASLIYAGERDGLGFRDTVQDMLGVMHTIPEEAGQRLELMITGQVSTGGAMPVVRQFDHHPGSEKAPREEEYRSDDCLWLFNAIPAYVKETGDLAFYHKVLPYADKGEDTVLGHMKRAIQFNLERSGAHGLPCGLSADWNDCIRLGQQGESIFVAFQLRYALQVYLEICRLLTANEEEEVGQG